MFIDRERELSTLRVLKASNSFQLVIVYGRRRIGKTSLLREFSKEMESIFFVNDETNENILLERFSKQVLSHFGMGDSFSAFSSWENAIRFVRERTGGKSVLLIIDEFPYLANVYPEIASVLQRLIDEELSSTRLFVVLCGSSVSFMEREVLGSRSPLFGRRTAQLKISPMSYLEASAFFPNMKPVDKLTAYGIMGGVPQYLMMWNHDASIKQNITRNFLNTSSYLYEEPRFLLKQELREPAVYNSIIESIARGASKLNTIANRISERNDKTAKYTRTLLDLDIIGRIVPVTEKENSRKSVYFIKDEMFRFWYTFVFSERSAIEAGGAEAVYDKRIAPQLDTYLGRSFEKICQQFLEMRNARGELNTHYTRIGRWWGNNPLKKKEEEIDLVCIGNDKMLFGECKWREQRTTLQDYQKLVGKSSLLSAREKRFVLFSKSGFSDELRLFAEKTDSLLLVSLEELFG